MLNSCVYTRISTHTLTDAINKEEYYSNIKLDSIAIYCRDDVYYAKHTFYKAPARGVLLSYGIFSKNNQSCEIYVSRRPEYIQGMEQVYLNEMYIVTALLMVMAYWRHKDNIVRLINGNERKTYLFKKNKVDLEEKSEATSGENA